MPNVSYVRPEVKLYIPEYQKITDCLIGETAVKKRGAAYLPKPNAEDTSVANVARYKAYLERAVFYNVAARTHAGLVGAVFGVHPTIKFDGQFEYMGLNVNGEGAGIEQLGKQALGGVLGYGRAGLFVDYPHVESTDEAGNAVQSRADVERQNLRPTIELYDSEMIINWRTRVDGGVEKLSLVVLKEKYIYKDDGFELSMKDQWRVLRLDESGFYVQEVWRERAAIMTFEPVDASGKRFTEIPFYFIGATDNSPSVEAPPLYSIVSLNLAHYRNSADYEESVYLCGQPTPCYSGLTEDWVKKVWKGNAPMFGSRAAITLPTGAKGELLQAQPNTLVKEAMTNKEQQMISLGAKLVEPKAGPQKTAYEASVDEASENSTLTGAAKNVNNAFENALRICTMFQGGGAPEFKLNTDFELAVLGTEERRQVISEWTQGAITWGEMRAQLRRAGIATEDDTTAKAGIDLETQKEAELFGNGDE